MTAQDAAQLVIAAADQGQAAVWAAGVSAVAALIAAVLVYRSNSKTTRVEYGASLRDDQLELIKELRADNAEQRQRLEAADARIQAQTDRLQTQTDRLVQAQRRITALETALHEAGIPIPDP